MPIETKRSSPSGTFTRAKRSSPASGSRTSSAEAERQPRDVRERLARADGERRQHREDLAREHLLELGALRLGRILDAADEDPLGGERGTELVAPERRLLRRQVEDAPADLGQRLLRRAAVGRADGEPGQHLILQAGDPHHEELVEDRRDDPAELDALEQRLVRIGGELEHAPHEVDLRQLAVEECVVAAVGARFDDRRQALQSFRNGLNGRLSIWIPTRPGRSIRILRAMPNDRLLAILAVIVGVVLIVIAVIYWVEPAELAAELLPGPPGRLQPPPRQARHRCLPGRPRLLRLRLVPDRPEALDRRDVILADLITYPQAIVLGLLQGVSELFPISSLGHSVILPSLLGWDIHQNDKYFLTFLVATHLATAIVLFIFFWRDWMRIFKGLGRSLRDREISEDDPDAKLGWLLDRRDDPGGHPRPDAAGLAAQGLRLADLGRDLPDAQRRAALRRRAAAPARAGHRDGRRHPDRAHGLLARRRSSSGRRRRSRLIPGFSRSGATMAGGLLVGLSNEDAARFAFLLATPIIGAAAVLKLPELFGSTGNGVRGQALVAALCSAAAAYLAVKFLMRYFETNTLMPFAIYCFAAGLACTVYFVS